MPRRVYLNRSSLPKRTVSTFRQVARPTKYTHSVSILLETTALVAATAGAAAGTREWRENSNRNKAFTIVLKVIGESFRQVFGRTFVHWSN